MTLSTCCVPYVHSRQLDEGQCKPVRKSCVTVACSQYPQSKVVCCQTLLSRNSSKSSSCLTMAGTERWESHECNKRGQCKGCSVYKQRTVEKGNRPKGERFETTAVVRVVMVETWTYEHEDYVFVFGNEVIADVQRREKHNCTDGASPSALSFWLRV